MGFKVNKGRFGRPTSVSFGNKALRVRAGVHGGAVRIGGHEIRSSSGRKRSAAPKRVSQEVAAQAAGVWFPKSGGYDIAIDLGEVGILNLVVDADQLTFTRIKTIHEARLAGNVERVTRAFRAFVMTWDARDDDGKPIPLTPGGVKRFGVDLLYGITAEILESLETAPGLFGHVITVESTGRSPRVTVRNRATGAVSVRDGVAKAPDVVPAAEPISSAVPPHAKDASSSRRTNRTPLKPKSKGVAYGLWLLTGLVGGHRYYLAKPGTGLLMTLTLGGLGVWWLIDGVLLARMIDAHRQGEA